MRKKSENGRRCLKVAMEKEAAAVLVCAVDLGAEFQRTALVFFSAIAIIARAFPSCHLWPLAQQAHVLSLLKGKDK